MSNKNVIIIILYTRMRHVQFKWRSCRWGWWRTIDPSTLVDKTDVKDGINPPSFMSNKNVIIIQIWDMYNFNGIHVGEGGEEQLIPPPSSIKLTWRMVLIYRCSCQLQISLYHIQYEWVGRWMCGWGRRTLTWRMVYIYRHSCKKKRFLWGRVMPMHNVLIDHTPCMNLNGTWWEPTGENIQNIKKAMSL